MIQIIAIIFTSQITQRKKSHNIMTTQNVLNVTLSAPRQLSNNVASYLFLEVRILVFRIDKNLLENHQDLSWKVWVSF